MRFLAPVFVVKRKHNLFVRLGADETEGARANGLAADLVAAAVGHNAHGAVGQIPQESGERLFEVEDDGEVVSRVDAIYELINACLGAANLSLQQRIESPLHITRRQRAAVVKLYPVMQMKNISERVGNIPALGQTGSDVQIGATGQQVVEDQVVDTFGLSVQTHARIEVGWAALNDHDQGVGVGLAGAGKGCGEKNCDGYAI